LDILHTAKFIIVNDFFMTKFDGMFVLQVDVHNLSTLNF